MPTLTTNQLDALETKLNNGDVVGFYTDLAGYGDAYGTLGIAITNNSGWQGRLANAFAASGAEDDSVTLNHGGTAWTSLNADIASRYLQAYRDNSNSTPAWDDVQEIHNDAYEFAGLDADDWFPNKLLNDSGDPAALWADFMDNEGASDLWDDAGAVMASGANLLFGPYLVYAVLTDQNGIDESEIDFARNFLNALAQMEQSELEEMLADYLGNQPMTDLLDHLSALPFIPENPFTRLPASDLTRDPSGNGQLGIWVPGVTVPFGQSEVTVSPIVLDVDASGTIELVALNASGSVYWDIDQDGFAEASGWITGGDGLLAIDLNSDGVINDHGELFGGTNGYVTLDAYDTDNNNAITSADTQFGDLLVWIDSNADGYSQSGELHSLTSLGITSIATSYSNVNYTIAGNQVSFQSTFVMNGNTYTSVDAFFAYDNVNSRYADDYTLDVRALFLPTLRGYGTLPDLHIAMSLDEDLLEMVQDLVTSSPSDVLGLLTTPDSGAIRDIMFRWAGVDGVSPSSRGSFMADARILDFLEEFMGKDYSQVGVGANPGSTTAAELVWKAWGNAYVEIAARVVYQTMAGGVFEDGPTYNPVSDAFEGTLSLETAEAWMEAAETPLDAFNTGWLIVKMMDDTVGIASLSSGELEDLQEILPWGITIEAFQNTIVQSGPTSGSSDDELILGFATPDIVYGNGGNDVLIGGGGADDLRGGAGDDTYIFAAGSGSDQIRDETSVTGTADTIRFVGYDAADVRLWTTETGYLYLASKAAPSDQLWVYVGTTGAGGTTGELALPAIEQVAFDDTTWSLAGALTIEGSTSGDYLFGTQYGDTLYGLDGADYLYGNRGNDTLNGGSGNDTLIGGAGDDTYIFASGSGSDTINADSGGTDAIRLNGYATTDVRVWSEMWGYLYVGSKASSTDKVAIYVGTTGASGTTQELAIPSIEQIVFDDTTTWSLTGGLSLEGTSSGDNLYGSQYADTLYGLDGSDVLYGNRGNDTLIGGAGGDTLYGGDGDDILYGGAGADTLNGGAGADDFIFEAASAFGAVDTISGFNTGQGDAVNIADLLSGYDPLTDAITDFVQITTSGSNSIVKVDADGGANNFVQIATISGVTGLTDEEALETGGYLIAA